MDDLAAEFGWDEATVARLRRLHDAFGETPAGLRGAADKLGEAMR